MATSALTAWCPTPSASGRWSSARAWRSAPPSRDLLYLVRGFRPAHGGVRGSDRLIRGGGCHRAAVREFHMDNPGVASVRAVRRHRGGDRARVVALPGVARHPACPHWWPSATNPARCGNRRARASDSSNAGLPHAHGEDLPPSPDAELMTALVEASRQAAGFREAIRAALDALRANVGARIGAPAGRRPSRGLSRHGIRSRPGLGRILDPAADRSAARTACASTARRCPSPPATSTPRVAGRRNTDPEHLAEIATLEDTGARLAVRVPHQQGSARSAPAGTARRPRPVQRRGKACTAQLRGPVRAPGGECAPDRSRRGTGKGAARSRAGGGGAKAPATAPGPRNHRWPRSPASISPPAASAAITTTSWIWAATTPASRWPTSRAKASPRHSSCPSCRHRLRVISSERDSRCHNSRPR